MRKQRAFATLTDAEIDQIADWLRHETYETVLERVRKSRPEDFSLDISRRPLERLYAKTNTLDKINARISGPCGEHLTLAEFDAITAAEKPYLNDDIHDAILEATYDLVLTGDNTPNQLLALQRLADFRARTALRAQLDLLDRGLPYREPT